MDDGFPPQDEGTELYAWHFPYPISYPTIVVEADANIQWINSQPKKFGLYFNEKEHNNYLYASLLTTSIHQAININLKVFSIGY